MPTPDPARRPGRAPEERGSFVLYVEGPRDRSVLQAWAQRVMPRQASAVVAGAVILGGRRPARALEHFRGCAAGSRAICVLDRDGGEPPPQDANEGLEFFTWGRRHIESYLLVPEAIRRALRLGAQDRRIDALLSAEMPPPEDAAAWHALDAKRLLGAHGPLAAALGRPLPLARIARATREGELHADVLDVLARLAAALACVAAQRPRRGARAVSRRKA